MRATARKVRGTYRVNPETGAEEMPPVFYALVVDVDRPIWICGHSHPTRKRANACARAHIRRLPRSGPAALRRLRETWTPRAVAVPLGVDGRPELRRSWVESFLQCVQHQDEENPDGVWGSIVHDAVHAYWQLCIARSEESMLSEVPRLVTEAFFRRPGADPNRYQEAVDVVDSFCSSRLLEAHRLLVIERRPVIEYVLRVDVGWAWLTGQVDRIDRVDGDDPDDPPTIIRIRDYKTGWASSGGRALDSVAQENGATRVVPHEFQRRFYAQLAFLDPALGGRLDAVETEIDYIRYRGEPEVITYYRGELDAWWQGVLWGLAQRWSQRDGPPTGSASCETCTLRSTCAASLTESKLVPSTEDQALALAERWIRTKALAGVQAGALRAFAKEHPAPLSVNGLEVGFLRPHKPQFKPRRDATLDIVKHLDLAGLNGESATYGPGIIVEKLPSNMKAPLVDAGLARWEYGAPEFKSRKAGED